MQRQLCLKFLSKIPRNPSCTNHTSSIFSSSKVPSSFLNTHCDPFHRQYFSHNSTPLWKLCGVRNGLLSNPIPASRSFVSSLLKGQSKFHVNGAIRIYGRRYFHSFDSQNRGWRSIFRRLTPDGVVIGIIVTNVAVFMLWRVADPQFMVNNFMISVDNFTSGRLHTLITSAFSHKDMWHLISNMIGLYFFGLSIGRTFGAEYLLKLYLSGAVVGSIFYLAYHGFIASSFQSKQTFGIDPSKIPGLGASGAVNAILLLDIFLFPSKTLYLDFIIPVPAVLLGIFIVGKDILRLVEGDRNVSGSAHLGGAMVAALAWAQRRRGRFRRF